MILAIPSTSAAGDPASVGEEKPAQQTDDHFPRLTLIHRREVSSRLAYEFGQGPAETDQDERAEGGVEPAADDKFQADLLALVVGSERYAIQREDRHSFVLRQRGAGLSQQATRLPARAMRRTMPGPR